MLGYFAPHIEDADIIYRIIGEGVGPVEGRRYSTTHILRYKTLLKNALPFSMLVFPILKWMGPYSLQTQLLIIVAVFKLHNYIHQEAHVDCLFEKYNS